MSSGDYDDRGIRALAVAVLQAAIKDRYVSREWLDSEEFELWCDLLNLDPQVVRPIFRRKARWLYRTAGTLSA